MSLPFMGELFKKLVNGGTPAERLYTYTCSMDNQRKVLRGMLNMDARRDAKS